MYVNIFTQAHIEPMDSPIWFQFIGNLWFPYLYVSIFTCLNSIDFDNISFTKKIFVFWKLDFRHLPKYCSGAAYLVTPKLITRLLKVFVFVLYLSCICLVFVLYLSCICLVFVLYLPCICLVFVLYLSCICLVIRQPMRLTQWRWMTSIWLELWGEYIHWIYFQQTKQILKRKL